MSENNIYSMAIPFAVIAAVVILIGTVMTVFVPMMTKEMHPKLETLEQYKAIELAGRNIYQREGCFNCHSQTVRPLESDVLAYGAYSQAGENYYERPFLWGSKRTGPDLARIGAKYPDEWHKQHFVNPQGFVPLSNMPKYTWLAKNKLDEKEIEKCMKALNFPYTEAEINALKDATELDAMVAYMQVVGISVPRSTYKMVDAKEYQDVKNPLSPDKEVLARGELLYKQGCFQCHGTDGQGTNIAMGMDMLAGAEVSDGQLFVAIANGLEGMMPSHINFMTKKDVWSLVAYCKFLGEKNQKPADAATK